MVAVEDAGVRFGVSSRDRVFGGVMVVEGADGEGVGEGGCGEEAEGELVEFHAGVTIVVSLCASR